MRKLPPENKSSSNLSVCYRIILAALGLPNEPTLPSHHALPKRLTELIPPLKRIKRSVILEAEVIPYNEWQREGGRGPGIEEFWWLGAAGVTAEKVAIDV